MIQQRNGHVCPYVSEQRRMDHRQLADIDFVSRCKEDMVRRHVFAIGEACVRFPADRLDAGDGAAFVQRDVSDHPVSQPVGRTGGVVAVVAVLVMLGKAVERIGKVIERPEWPAGSHAGLRGR